MNGAYGLVRFGTDAETISNLTTAEIVNNFLDNTTYIGGLTNTAQAISQCTAVLDGGTASKRILVLLTDGNPTAGGGTNAAEDAAEAARNKNYTVLPVAIGGTISNATLLTWAGDGGTVLTADDFDGLDALLEDELIENIACGPTAGGP